MPLREAALLGAFGRLKSIVKHRIGGGWVSSTKTGGPILTIYTSYDVLLPFGGRDDCTGVKIFNGVNF